MNLETMITYREEYLPSPRHRKLRIREVEKEATFELEDFTKADVPLALTTVSYDGCTNSYFYKNGQFYKNTGEEATIENLKKVISFKLYETTSYEAAVAEFQNAVSHYINVDGILFIKEYEPMYEVKTFGLGNNHGGTALMLDSYRPNNPNSYKFNALQREEAIAFGKYVATRRGDTNSIEGINTSYNIIVHLPEAVTHDPQAEAKKANIESIKKEAVELLCKAIPTAYCESLLGDDGLDKIAEKVLEIADYDVEKYYAPNDVKEAMGQYLTRNNEK